MVASPVAVLKAVKNATELEGFRQSHIRDGIALARYFSWLEEKLQAQEELTEWEGSEQLEKFRRCALNLFTGGFIIKRLIHFSLQRTPAIRRTEF